MAGTHLRGRWQHAGGDRIGSAVEGDQLLVGAGTRPIEQIVARSDAEQTTIDLDAYDPLLGVLINATRYDSVTPYPVESREVEVQVTLMLTLVELDHSSGLTHLPLAS